MARPKKAVAVAATKANRKASTAPVAYTGDDEEEEEEEQEEEEGGGDEDSVGTVKLVAVPKAAKATKAKAAKLVVTEPIKIPPIALKQIRVTLQGETPLLVNRFDEKSRQQIEDNYRGTAKNKAVPRTAEEEFQASLYPMPGNKGGYGIPASGIKKCAVSACRFVDGVPMTIAKGAFHVIGDVGGLIPIAGDEPVIDERIVRVGNFGSKKPATRRRGRFDNWEVSFIVKYNEGVLNAEQILNLYENAGFSVGLCEFRPEKDGNLGMFRVKRG